MEWLAVLVPAMTGAPIPGAVEYGSGGNLLFLLALITASVPVLVLVRNARTRRRAGGDTARLRVLDGGRELRRRAA